MTRHFGYGVMENYVVYYCECVCGFSLFEKKQHNNHPIVYLYRIFIADNPPANLGLFRQPVELFSTVRHPVVTKLRPMSNFGQVTVTTC